MYVTASVDDERCNGCRLCILACPEPNTIVHFPAPQKVRVVAARCKGCGLCVEHCPRGCVSLERPPAAAGA
ncbi:MAG: 4Fe-4S dicluster-binding protein [Thermodesulfobacteriota bacterium]